MENANELWQELANLKQQKSEIENKISEVQTKISQIAVFANESKTAHFESGIFRLYSKKTLTKKKTFNLETFLQVEKNKIYEVKTITIDEKKILADLESQENETLNQYFEIKETETKIFELK